MKQYLLSLFLLTTNALYTMDLIKHLVLPESRDWCSASNYAQEPADAFYHYSCDKCHAQKTSPFSGKGRHMKDCTYKGQEGFTVKKAFLFYEFTATCPYCKDEYYEGKNLLGNVLRYTEKIKQHIKKTHSTEETFSTEDLYEYIKIKPSHYEHKKPRVNRKKERENLFKELNAAQELIDSTIEEWNSQNKKQKTDHEQSTDSSIVNQ